MSERAKCLTKHVHHSLIRNIVRYPMHLIIESSVHRAEISRLFICRA